MGFFGTKTRLASKPRQLRLGTEIPMVDVEPGWVEWARSEKPKTPRVGHVVTVRVDLVGDAVEVRAGGGGVVGRMDPKCVGWYLDEFRTMQTRGEYGVTEAYVKWDGSKSPHAIGLNWGVGAVDGGIL